MSIPLRIFLDSQHYALLPVLKLVFPGLSADLRCDGLLSYFTWIDRTHVGTLQMAFLRNHTIPYLDLEKEHAYCIREFFRGVCIDGVPITEFCFPGIAMPDHFAVILHFEDGRTLQIAFPMHWLPLGGLH